MKQNYFINALAAILFFFAVGLGAIYIFPWGNVDWGKVSLIQDNLIVVTGTSKEQKRNDAYHFFRNMNSSLMRRYIDSNEAQQFPRSYPHRLEVSSSFLD